MKRSTYTPPEDSCLITGTAIDLLPHPPISVTACHCPRTRHTVQSAHLAAGLPVSAAPCEYTPCSYTRLPPPVQPSTEVTTCMQANHERTAWSVYERRQQQRRQKPPEKLDIFARVLAPTQHRRSPWDRLPSHGRTSLTGHRTSLRASVRAGKLVVLLLHCTARNDRPIELPILSHYDLRTPNANAIICPRFFSFRKGEKEDDDDMLPVVVSQTVQVWGVLLIGRSRP
jgi:hypothetical protein